MANKTKGAVGYDAILLVTGSRWDQDYSSASISIAKELSKSKLVLFFDNPFTWKDVIKGWRSQIIRKRIKALLFGIGIYHQIDPKNKNWIAITPLAVIPINWLPSGYLYDLFSSFNNLLFTISLRRAIKDFDLKNYILFNSYNPFYAYQLPKGIDPKLIIYQSRDNIKESEYVKKHGPYHELKALKAANLRLATSSDLVEKLSTINNPVTFFPNAADFSLFNQASSRMESLPESLKSLKKPIIGYIGNICLRLDYTLIRSVAHRFQDCTILMVGPRNDAGHHNYRFEELTNVVFVGAKKLVDLPQYLSVMDCTLLPFKVNELTRSIYPLKINEYMAAGKPVVSTEFSVDIKLFQDIIYIAKNDEDFLVGIERALSEKSLEMRQRRIAVAKDNTWANRVKQFWDLVDNNQVT